MNDRDHLVVGERSQYDLFISYRSEDIHMVRPVAEQLLANGLCVWFAEYEILLSGREHFEKAMAHGLSNCAYGVCFTNDKYASSPHCCKELQRLLERLGADRIIEIRCSNQPLTHQKFPALKNAHIFDYTDMIQVLRDIQSVTGYHSEFSVVEIDAPADWHIFSSSGIRCSLDFGGWNVRKPLWHWLGSNGRHFVTYQRLWKGNKLRGHLVVGTMDVARSSTIVAEDDDDRSYYKRALKFAGSFYESHVHQKPIGVHLSFVPGHLSQAVITTRYTPNVISRLYSITLLPTKSQIDLELTFFFFFNGAINDFWRQGYLMDRIVHSLRVEDHPTVVSWLMSIGQAAFSFLGTSKEKKLGKAVLRGSVPRVIELLRRGANPNATRLTAVGPRGIKVKGTPLMAAASEGLSEIVTELLAHGACVDQTDVRGWTALLYAAENGYHKICRLLMDHGADPNVRSAQSGTALMVAALKGNTDVVQVLLEYGADPLVRDSIGKSALDLAQKYGRSDVVRILTKYGQSQL